MSLCHSQKFSILGLNICDDFQPNIIFSFHYLVAPWNKILTSVLTSSELRICIRDSLLEVTIIGVKNFGTGRP